MPLKVQAVVSSKIANASLVAAMTVVLTHFPHGDKGAVGWFYNVFPGAFLGFAVPFFFIVSGYLLAGHCGEDGWWKNALVKRAKTLLVPYLVLNLLFGVWLVTYRSYLAPMFGNAAMPITWQTPLEMLGLLPLGGGPAIGPLWYVRGLLIFVLISPAVYWIIRKSMWLALVVMMLVLALWVPTVYRVGYPLMYFFNGLGFVCFMLGMLIRIKGLRMECVDGIKVWAPCLVIGWSLMAFAGDNSLYGVRIVGYGFTIVGLWALVPSSPWPSSLTANSFPIYVFHAIIIHFLVLVTRRAGFAECLSQNLAVNLAGVAVVVVLSCVMARFTRLNMYVAKLILGGR